MLISMVSTKADKNRSRGGCGAMAALVHWRWGNKVIWLLLKTALRFFKKMELIYTAEIFQA